MLKKSDLPQILHKTLLILGGRASIIDVFKQVWQVYQKDLEESSSLFYTWQYDIRWAATYLRKKEIIVAANNSPKGIWELNF